MWWLSGQDLLPSPKQIAQDDHGGAHAFSLEDKKPSDECQLNVKILVCLAQKVD